MFTYAFQYQRAQSAAHAVSLATELPDAKFLAGGQTLVQTMKLRLAAPSDLIDLGAIEELRGIHSDERTVTIGAMTRHVDVSRSADVRRRIPALADLASQIGDRQVRNRGTLGGSLANNDPAADYPAAVLALAARITTDRRTIPADDYFMGLYATALEPPSELITSVSFPVPRRAAYVKFKSPASRFALVGVFVADFGDHVRVAVTGAGPCVFRVTAMEKALGTHFAAEALADIRVDPDGLSTDLHASAAYRAHLIPVLARRAVMAAMAHASA